MKRPVLDNESCPLEYEEMPQPAKPRLAHVVDNVEDAIRLRRRYSLAGIRVLLRQPSPAPQK